MKPRPMVTISALSAILLLNQLVFGNRRTTVARQLQTYMKTQNIKLDEKTVTISKLPLGKYAELLKALKELPKKVEGLDKMTPDEVMKNAPQLIGEALPEFIQILSIATPLTKEELEQIGLDEAVRLVIAVFEVNNYREVYENAKKALARPAEIKRP